MRRSLTTVYRPYNHILTEQKERADTLEEANQWYSSPNPTRVTDRGITLLLSERGGGENSTDVPLADLFKLKRLPGKGDLVVEEFEDA